MYRIENQRGTSLITVLVAVAIAGILSLAVAAVLSSQAKGNKQIDLFTEARSLRNEIAGALEIPNICTQNMKAVHFPASNSSAHIAPITKLSIFDVSGLAQRDLAEVGKISKNLPQLVVKTIQAEKFIQVSASPEIWSFSLRLSFLTPHNDYILPRDIEIGSLMATVSGGATKTITNCRYGSAVSIYPSQPSGGANTFVSVGFADKDNPSSATWADVQSKNIPPCPASLATTPRCSPVGSSCYHPNRKHPNPQPHDKMAVTVCETTINIIGGGPSD